MPKKKTQNTSFNWFDIFKAGTHTDSNGHTHTFSEQDLHSVVQNFSANTAPLVIGHPKLDDPAWGWASALKVEDGVLYAKADDVCCEFAEAVADKRYPNRSVRLEPAENGYKLAHIGYLGGKPPAVDGLKWQFNANTQAMVFEFNQADEAADRLALQSANVLTRFFGNLRTFLVEQFDSKTADAVVPHWDAEYLTQQTAVAEHERAKAQQSHNYSKQDNPDDSNNPSNKTEPEEDTDVEKEELEKKLKAEQKKNAELEYNQRVAAATTFIDTLNNGKAPRVTNTQGLAEFMASLPEDGATFEFAKADNATEQVSAQTWFKQFLTALPEQTNLTREFNKQTDDDHEPTAPELASKALEYQKAQAQAGVTISVASALAAVSG